MAFQRNESTKDGAPTADALLGSLMTAEAQAAQVHLLELVSKFVTNR